MMKHETAVPPFRNSLNLIWTTLEPAGIVRSSTR